MKRFLSVSFVSVLVASCFFACGNGQKPKAQNKKVKVEVIAGRGGTVEVSPTLPEDGICDAGTTFTVKATVNDGYDFARWTMNEQEVHGTELTWNFTANNEDIKIHAYFLNKTKFAVTIEESENGIVTAHPEIPQDKMVRGNTIITFTATANEGFVVNEWVIVGGEDPIAGGEDGDATVTLEIVENLNITATFKSDVPLENSGDAGSLHWEVFESGIDNVLKITGRGAIPNYSSIRELPWAGHVQTITKIIIEDGCTEIGEHAFDSMVKLRSASIPNTVTHIGKWSFQAALSLVEIDIPASVKIIDESAFEDIQELRTLTLHEGLETIGEFAFSGCAKMTSFKLPSTLQSIGRSAFEGCEAITQISVPANVKKILENTFTNCSALSSLTLNEGLEEIAKEAFNNCVALKSVSIPSSVTAIGAGAFSDCGNMDTITVATGNTHFEAENGVLYNIGKTRLLTYLPKNTSTSFNLPSTVTEIDAFAFSGVTALTNVNFTENIATIGENAFTRCDGLTTINLPASLTNIANAPFHNCTSLTSINIPNTNQNYLTEDGMLYNKEKTHIIQYPAGKDSESYVAPDTLKKVGGYAFFGNKKLKKVELPHTLNFVGIFAFGFCSGIEKFICKVKDPSTITTELHAFFRGEDAIECMLYVPKGSASKYLELEEWLDGFGENIDELP